MKMKRTIYADAAEYKRRTAALREQLARCKTTGVLPADFEKELDELSRMEETLLYELIPYYRQYGTGRMSTSVSLETVKEQGSSLQGYPKQLLQVNEHLYIVNRLDGKIQFCSLAAPESPSREYPAAEWGYEMKEIRERIICMQKRTDGGLLLLGENGSGYMAVLPAVDRLPDGDDGIQLTRIEGSRIAYKLSNAVCVNDQVIAAVDEQYVMRLFELQGNKLAALHAEKGVQERAVENISALEKTEDGLVLAGTAAGELYCMRYRNRGMEIVRTIKSIEGRVRKILCLVSERSAETFVLLLGDGGQYAVISLGAAGAIQSGRLEGNLFEGFSQNETAAVLSDSGSVYLFEENFGEWRVNERVTINGTFFTNICGAADDDYLLLDLSRNLHWLRIDRLRTPADLAEVRLYD